MERAIAMNSLDESLSWIEFKSRAGWVNLAAPANNPHWDEVNPPCRLACAKSMKRESKTDAPVDSVGVEKSSRVHSETGRDSRSEKMLRYRRSHQGLPPWIRGLFLIYHHLHQYSDRVDLDHQLLKQLTLLRRILDILDPLGRRAATLWRCILSHLVHQ